jgi:hypothetical protein
VQRARDGAAGGGILLSYELTPSAISRDGDDEIVIFGVAGVWAVQEWSHIITDTGIFCDKTNYWYFE